MDVPNLSGGPAVTPEAQPGKSKLGLFAALLVVVAVLAGGYYYFAGSSADGPPTLESEAKATQGFIKIKGSGFLAPEKKDAANFTEKAKKFVTDKLVPTPLPSTKTNKGMHYIYWDGTAGTFTDPGSIGSGQNIAHGHPVKSASFQDVIENANPAKAKQFFIASWNTAKNYFDTTPHTYYKKKDGDKIITKEADVDQLKNVPVKEGGGVILMVQGDTEIYGFKDGNTFAKKEFGICDASTPNGWNLFASHTKSAADLVKVCKNGQVKEMHIQTSVDPVKFKKADGTETLKYSMVWVKKGDEVKVSTGGDTGGDTGGGTDTKPVMKDHKYTVEGDILKVQFVGTTTDKVYALAKTPSNLKVVATSGYNGNADDAYVKVFTSADKYIGSFEFKNTTAKEFSHKLESEFNTKYTFTISGNTISLKEVPVEEGKKTSPDAPAKATWVTPAAGTEVDLSDLKAKGLTFVATDLGNTKFHQKIGGKYAANYKFSLAGPGTKWNTSWNASFPGGDSAQCSKTSDNGQAVWACSHGTVPASAFASATAGAYTLSIETGDGKDGSGWSDVKFNVKAAEAATDPKKCYESNGRGGQKEVECVTVEDKPADNDVAKNTGNDHIYVVNGNTLEVTFKGESKATKYTLDTPGLTLTSSKGPVGTETYNNEDTYVNVHVGAKYLGLFELNATNKSFHIGLGNGGFDKGYTVSPAEGTEYNKNYTIKITKNAVNNAPEHDLAYFINKYFEVSPITNSQNYQTGDYTHKWKIGFKDVESKDSDDWKKTNAPYKFKVSVFKKYKFENGNKVDSNTQIGQTDTYSATVSGGNLIELNKGDSSKTNVAQSMSGSLTHLEVPTFITFPDLATLPTPPVYGGPTYAGYKAPGATQAEVSAWEDHQIKVEVLYGEKTVKTITQDFQLLRPHIELTSNNYVFQINNYGKGKFPKDKWQHEMMVYSYGKSNFGKSDDFGSSCDWTYDNCSGAYGYTIDYLANLADDPTAYDASTLRFDPPGPGGSVAMNYKDYDDDFDSGDDAKEIVNLSLYHKPLNKHMSTLFGLNIKTQ